MLKTLEPLRERFDLSPATDDAFFSEWQQNLPSLTETERVAVEEIYQRFRRHRDRDTLSEGLVNQLLVSPLLTLAGLFDPPFYGASEATIMLRVERENEILRGRIDTLVIQDQLWVLVVESKDSLSFTIGLPQALTYMLASPPSDRPLYGLITSGDEFLFIKLQQGNPPIYDTSDVFYLLQPRRNQLLNVFAILKQIRQVMQ
jgi:hypothetical protein